MQSAGNRFAAAAFDDSDDETVQNKMTKTQVKKEERKITEKKAPKVNAQQLEADGFAVVSKDNNSQAQRGERGGRGANRGGDRGGRGGDRRGRGAPRGGARGGAGARTDADGNKIGADNYHNNDRTEHFTGKPRQEAHPMDRQSGTGRGRRPVNKRDGAGKANVGYDEKMAYKKKQDGEGEATKEEEKVEEVPAEPKIKTKTEVIGVSMQDYLQSHTMLSKKQAREAEIIKEKTEASSVQKVHQSTVLQNQYQKGSVAKTSDKEVANMTGFGNVKDDDFEGARGGDRGRGGDRRGRRSDAGRGGRPDAGQKGGRRQNPKAALKKTEEDFPTL